MHHSESTGPTCFEFRSLLNRDFIAEEPAFPFVSLSTSAFETISTSLPPTTPLIESNVLVNDLYKRHQLEENAIRQQYEAKSRERDHFYIRALTDITETLRAHSISIDELRQRK